MTAHSESTVNHPPENWTYADEAAMNAATGFVAGEIGRLAYVEDTGNYHRLLSIDGSGDPTWSGAIGAVSLPAYTVDFTIGAEGSNTINVAMQFQVDGANLAEIRAFDAWLSDSPSAGSGTANTPDTAVSGGTNGFIAYEPVSDIAYKLVTNATGAVDIDITHAAGANTWYLVVQFPDGTIAISGAITFA